MIKSDFDLLSSTSVVDMTSVAIVTASQQKAIFVEDVVYQR